MRILSLLLTLLLTNTSFANTYQKEECAEYCSENPVGKGPGYGKEKCELNMGYSAPARIDPTCSYDVFFEGSFLYWYVGQTKMDLAGLYVVTTLQTASLVFQEQTYKPGFKLVLGTNFNHDDWTGKLEYTQIHSSTRTVSDLEPVNENFINPSAVWTGMDIDDANPNQIKSKWGVKLEVLDGEMSRKFYSGRQLTIEPFFGTRSARIKQRVKYLLRDANTDIQSLNKHRSHAWLLGPRTGTDFNWILGWGFRFTGSAAASLLYQRTKVRTDLADEANLPVQKIRERIRSITPNVELGLGLGWGSYFWDNQTHFDLSASYEFHYWWEQNQMRAIPLALSFNGPISPGNLYYHGLTLSARLDF